MRVWKKLRKWSVIYSLKKELGPAERHIKSIENLPFYNVEISSSNKDVLQIRLLLKMESLRIVGSELKCQNFKLSPKYLFQFVKQTTFDLICRRYEVIPFSLSVMKVNLILFFFITFQSIFDFVNTSVGWKINGTKSFHFSKACPMTASHLNILLHLIDEILNKSSWFYCYSLNFLFYGNN